MVHTYGISFNFSFKFKDKIENVSDGISQKQTIRKYFGSSPFLTPDKKTLVFQKNNNQLIIGLNESPIGSNIGVTAKYDISKELLELKEVAIAVQECCTIVNKEIGVKIERIGSINQFTGSVMQDDSYSVLEKHFVRNIIDNVGDFNGGDFKYLYRDTPKEIGKSLNINIGISSSDKLDIVNVILDINNNEGLDYGAENDNILKIAQYSFNFLSNNLVPSLEIKGIKLNDY